MATEEAVFKRLKSLDQSQESIETVSLWCLHHKDSAQVIADTWLSAFRTASEAQRLSLFYVANDVCQKSKKKRYEVLRNAFGTGLPEAIALLRHNEGIKGNVMRIVDIWDERDVFDSQTIGQFRSSLNMTFDDSGSDTDEKFLLDFEPANLVDDLDKFQRCEASIEKAKVLLPAANFDFRGRLKECLKDRTEGIRVVREVEAASRKMSAFVAALEEQVVQHHRLIGLLEQARSFFGQQLRDATVVEDAYRKFGNGIQNVKDQLEEMQRTGVFLGASPPRDAPSPSAGDDPFAESIEAALIDMKRPGNRDIIEASDMDLEEDKSFENVIVGDNNSINLQTNQSFFKAEKDPSSGDGYHKVDPRIERQMRIAMAKEAELSAAESNHSQPVLQHPPPNPQAWNGGPRTRMLSPTSGHPFPATWVPPPGAPHPHGSFSVPPPPYNFYMPPPNVSAAGAPGPNLMPQSTSPRVGGTDLSPTAPKSARLETPDQTQGIHSNNLTLLSGETVYGSTTAPPSVSQVLMAAVPLMSGSPPGDAQIYDNQSGSREAKGHWQGSNYVRW